MRIFFPDIHFGLTKNVAKIFMRLGHILVLPDESYKPSMRPQPPIKDFVWNEKIKKNDIFRYESKVEVVTKQELLDNPPDIIFVTNYESRAEIIHNIWPKVKHKSKLAYYSGNVYWENAYPLLQVKNYLAADSFGMAMGIRDGVKNLCQFLPLLEHEDVNLSYSSGDAPFGSYINDYPHNFKEEYDFVNLAVKEAGVALRMCDNMSQSEIFPRMVDSIATIHIKRTEGLGMSIIESLSHGRPVILSKQFSSVKTPLGDLPMSYKQWCVQDFGAFYIDSQQELVELLKRLKEDGDFRAVAQKRAYDTIRQELYEEKVLDSMDKFLMNCH